MVNIQHGDDEIAEERHGCGAETLHTVFPPEEQQRILEIIELLIVQAKKKK